MTIPYPSRLPLANLPTPVRKLSNSSAHLGVEFYIKQDDLTGAALSGNKIRKLEFLLADAQQQAANVVITCGGEQSNHCRATAIAAKTIGMDSILLLRTENPAAPPRTSGNIVLDRMVGSDIVWISHAQWAERNRLMEEQAERVRNRGQVPYIIGEGGSNAVGAWGYIKAAEELASDLAALTPVPTTIVHACGSGGTAAGLILGAQLLGFRQRDIQIACVNVCDDREYFTQVIGNICEAFIERYGCGDMTGLVDSLTIIDGYVGRGYAKSTEEELREMIRLARSDAVILDPVYTGKAYFGLTRELRIDPTRFGARIVFVHTGGIFGLFDASRDWDTVLNH